MAKRRREIDPEEVHFAINQWLDEEEDAPGDNLGELYGEERCDESDSEEEGAEEKSDDEGEEVPIIRKPLKRKKLTRSRKVNSIDSHQKKISLL